MAEKPTISVREPPRQRSLEQDIAFVFEVPEALLPVLAELYEGLPDLSGCTADVLTLLRRGGLPQGASVLDLGCGRGEIALSVAEAFGASVTGIDGYGPFVDMARNQAISRGLNARCHFEQGDLREILTVHEGHDAVLMIALGPVLGDAATTVDLLRRAVKPGGLIVIDDGYLVGTPPAAPGREDYPPLAEMERGLTQHGDRILVRLDRRNSMAAFDRVADPAVIRNAAAISKRRPDLAPLLRAYLEEQFSANAPWKTRLMPAMWALRRV